MYKKYVCKLTFYQLKQSGSKYINTIETFAYGTYMEYNEKKADMIELHGYQEKKLKMITIAELASKNKTLHYGDLQKQLNINNVRELEDTIIECMYNQLIRGRLDQKEKKLMVEYTFGRDARPSVIPKMLEKLENWHT